VLSNLGNPKMAVFFASLLPQFGDSFVALLALGLLFCSLTLLWLTLYACAIDRLRRLLGGRVRRALDALTGAVLVALGVRLAAER
jgi:threonine/homoserine/homoserine lactone efflux protein